MMLLEILALASNDLFQHLNIQIDPFPDLVKKDKLISGMGTCGITRAYLKRLDIE